MSVPGIPTGSPELNALLPPDFVAPAYGGHSIANLPATLGRILNVPDGWAAPPLDDSLLSALGETDRVILLVVDGVGWNRLQSELKILGTSVEESLDLAPRLDSVLTSVAPATTSAATTVLLGNGAGPAETGMLGYTFLLPRLGVLANMLLFQPVGNAASQAGDLEEWGVVPEAFSPTPSLAQALAGGGVDTTAFLPARLTRTPLSRLQLRGSAVDGYLNWTDLWHKLHGWMGEGGNRRRLAYGYLPDFDGLSHRDGTENGLWSSMWGRLAAELREFIALAAKRSGRRSLLLITADHGHVNCPLELRHLMQDYRQLSELTLLGPGGEARHVNLYARGGAKEELLAYCREELGDAFAVLDALEALKAGLYGPVERLHPETPARLGDVLLLSKGANHLWDREAKGSMIGMHGSLEPDEALVPLLGFEL